jgi:hypothetical protein
MHMLHYCLELKIMRLIVFLCNFYYAGDNVQGACYAFPPSGKCYAFVIVPSIQVSFKRLGQYCAYCLLLHSGHCCSLVSPNFLGISFADVYT